jgi:hypothetical protein
MAGLVGLSMALRLSGELPRGARAVETADERDPVGELHGLEVGALAHEHAALGVGFGLRDRLGDALERRLAGTGGPGRAVKRDEDPLLLGDLVGLRWGARVARRVFRPSVGGGGGAASAEGAEEPDDEGAGGAPGVGRVPPSTPITGTSSAAEPQATRGAETEPMAMAAKNETTHEYLRKDTIRRLPPNPSRGRRPCSWVGGSHEGVAHDRPGSSFFLSAHETPIFMLVRSLRRPTQRGPRSTWAPRASLGTTRLSTRARPPPHRQATPGSSELLARPRPRRALRHRASTSTERRSARAPRGRSRSTDHPHRDRRYRQRRRGHRRSFAPGS